VSFSLTNPQSLGDNGNFYTGGAGDAAKLNMRMGWKGCEPKFAARAHTQFAPAPARDGVARREPGAEILPADKPPAMKGAEACTHHHHRKPSALGSAVSRTF
jgi:hypothetical protein